MAAPPKPKPRTTSRPPKPPAGVEDTVTLTGPLPERDGDVNVYDCDADPAVFAPGLKGKKNLRRTSARKVIFVNGMGGNPQKHRAQACAVSAVSGTKVWGVYNAPGTGAGPLSGMRDLVQCLTDKTTSKLGMKVTALGSSVAALITGADKASLVKSDLIDALGKRNPATAALFDLLSTPGFETARVVAHSQGNIITCNALNALAVLKGPTALAKLAVYSFGSPVTFWPDNVAVRKFGFINDPITYLSLDTEYDHDQVYGFLTTAKVEAGSEVIQRWNGTRRRDYVNPAAQLSHAFYIYVEAYWDALAEEFGHD